MVFAPSPEAVEVNEIRGASHPRRPKTRRLPVVDQAQLPEDRLRDREPGSRIAALPDVDVGREEVDVTDRKSTRLNSSHVRISYAVFCLKKKKRKNITI